MTCIDPKQLWPLEAVPNNKYKGLSKMALFTAGDESQFDSKRSFNNGKGIVREIDDVCNRWVDKTGVRENLWKEYKMTATATSNTFDYIFNKFKKGIFVKILDNKVETFLPFSKQSFKNDWGDLMKYDPTKFKNMTDFMKFIHDETVNASGKMYKFKPERISKYTDSWYANNCLIRFEHPLSEADTNVVTMRHLFQELCATRDIPDIEFFVNRRDFPLVTRNETEPYYNIFGKNVKLDSKTLNNIRTGGFCPVLSMCTADLYADIAIPTHEDWARIASTEGVLTYPTAKPEIQKTKITFPPGCEDYSKRGTFNTPWEQRKPTAVFRGASTGCGITSDLTKKETFNQRLLAAKISYLTKPDKFNVPFIDAGITKWNLRPRKIVSEEYLQTIDVSKEAPKVPPLSPEEQSKYKYLINIDGHVSAFRLSLEMSMGCCIILVDSLIPVQSSQNGNGTQNGRGWKMWFSHLLEPYVHYVPVKCDLSDLIDKIQWCRDNDEKCKEMAMNAKKFSKTYLSRDGVLDYMQNLMIELNEAGLDTDVVYAKDPVEIQHLIQSNYLLHMMTESIKSSSPISFLMPKPIPIYNIVDNSKKSSGLRGFDRGSFGWSKGYSLFLRNMFRPKSDWHDKLVHSRTNQMGVFYKKLFENADGKGIVELFYIGGSAVVKKSSSDHRGMLEHTNEGFISDVCLNNLLQTIPNFAWSFAFEKTLSNAGEPQCSLLNEYIYGESLNSFIHSAMKENVSKFPLKNIMEILVQIMFALQFAQDQCGFVHNNLTPRNILIQVLKDPITIEYPLFDGIYKIITKHMPVIINYGKSHVVADIADTYSEDKSQFFTGEGVHYGITNMFEMMPCVDVFSFVLLSCFDMLMNSERVFNEQIIFHLLNFFSPQILKTRKDALSFIHKYKHESQINTPSDIDLTRKPLDFVKWCTEILKDQKVAFGKAKNFSPNALQMNFGNARQLFDEAHSSNVGDINESFLQIPERFFGCSLPQPSTKIELYMVAQAFCKCLDDSLKDYKNFLQNKGKGVRDKEKSVLTFTKAKKFIKDFYSKRIQIHGADTWVIKKECVKEFKLNTQMFLDLDLLLKKSPSVENENNGEYCIDLSYFKSKILRIFNWINLSESGLFEVSEKDKKEIADQLGNVMQSEWKDKKISADHNTFLFYSRIEKFLTTKSEETKN